jgi:hypothetical protein
MASDWIRKHQEDHVGANLEESFKREVNVRPAVVANLAEASRTLPIDRLYRKTDRSVQPAIHDDGGA